MLIIIVKENDDLIDGFDAILFMADCYSDEEWRELLPHQEEEDRNDRP